MFTSEVLPLRSMANSFRAFRGSDRSYLSAAEFAAPLRTPRNVAAGCRDAIAPHPGIDRPSRYHRIPVHLRQRIRFWLETVFQGDWDRARAWLYTRLLDLRGKTPMDVIRQQRLDRVIEILATAHEGAFI
jgi:Protein of unknown function (DUF2384)